VVPEITACQQVHDQVQVLSVLEGVVHVDQKRTVEKSQDLSLVHHGLYTALGQDSGLVHLLHRVYLPILFVLYFPDLAETTFADALVVVE
jgi:hypothetical protein